jgi:IS5 family transposase
MVCDHAHNGWGEGERYHQHSICETVNSVIKRSYGSAVRARAWYCQFREISLTPAVYNLELPSNLSGWFRPLITVKVSARVL